MSGHLRVTYHPNASARLSAATEAAPGCAGDMADTPRDAGLKPAPAPRNEKAPVDFGYVGIDSILEQMRRKAMKQGFEFNIMVVGESPAQPQGGRLRPGPLSVMWATALACGTGCRWPVMCIRVPACGFQLLRAAAAPHQEPPGERAGADQCPPGSCSSPGLQAHGADPHTPRAQAFGTRKK